jgi:hypothetical protein
MAWRVAPPQRLQARERGVDGLHQQRRRGAAGPPRPQVHPELPAAHRVPTADRSFRRPRAAKTKTNCEGEYAASWDRVEDRSGETSGEYKANGQRTRARVRHSTMRCRMVSAEC